MSSLTRQQHHQHHSDSSTISDSLWVQDPSSGLYWNSSAAFSSLSVLFSQLDTPQPNLPHSLFPSSSFIKPSSNSFVNSKNPYVDEEGHPVEPDALQSACANHSRSVVHYEDVSDGEEGEVHAKLEDALPTTETEESIRVPPLRLCVLEPHRTSSIGEGQKVLILDLQTPVTIGRDRAFGPSLRLKEMEVSKTHLTLFSDPGLDSEEGPGWFVVDNASTLGTFVCSSKDERRSPTRLSEAKVASQPLRLSHLDTISISSATEPVVAFEVHYHPKFPSSCSSCALSPDESNRLRLTTDPIIEARSALGKDTEGGNYAMTPQDAKANRERKRKTEMAKLRNQFFGESSEQRPRKRPASVSREQDQDHGELESEPDKFEEAARLQPKYVDRAKLRRQTNGIQGALRGSSRPKFSEARPQPPTSLAQEDPFGASSRGAALLAKVGGGTVSMGAVVEARTMGINQAGLGSRALVVGVEEVARASSGSVDWREQAREASRRRYQAL
ncbi:hypothetical protein CROQUDRAFT_90582 [Cronartium quercuum f. sp. fusiforme G11]|uniref:FHA domain-containing protein n=1 Tax=Cronartium quercuum f. sp. fusiforme G11 TaxID=708437 RepID=A0A9P6NRJ1_9BASI|nr:hypothetical protein CROQUDRAFT_90582 [Cronartium quercuum f. sp. fusiforme G11]